MGHAVARDARGWVDNRQTATASQLNRLDLPTLGRPTMTICGIDIGLKELKCGGMETNNGGGTQRGAVALDRTPNCNTAEAKTEESGYKKIKIEKLSVALNPAFHSVETINRTPLMRRCMRREHPDRRPYIRDSIRFFLRGFAG